MPITITSGGINAVRSVILYPKICIIPTLQITPVMTISSDKNVVLIDRNINNKISAESASDPKINHFISRAILSAI